VTRFVIRRLAVAVLQVLTVTFIAYMLFYVISALTGADPAQRVAGKAASPEQVARVAAMLGTDKPWWQQYLNFLAGILHGDFGYSFQQRLPVSELLFPAAFVTASLVIGAAIIWMLVAVPVGLIGALRPRSVADRVSAVLIQIAIAAPVFWVAPMISYLFAYQPSQGTFLGLSIPPVELFPIQGYVDPFGPTGDPGQWVRSLILPCFALALGFAAFYARFIRAFVLEQLSEDYVLVAPAILTLLALDVGATLGGALFVEVTFGLPGLGYLAYSSIENLDYPLTVGVVTFAALMAVLANTLADIAQAALDPRVRR